MQCFKKYGTKHIPPGLHGSPKPKMQPAFLFNMQNQNPNKVRKLNKYGNPKVTLRMEGSIMTDNLQSTGCFDCISIFNKRWHKLHIRQDNVTCKSSCAIFIESLNQIKNRDLSVLFLSCS